MEKKKKKGMNLPNKITCARLVISVIVLVILCFAKHDVGIAEAERSVIIFGVQIVDWLYLVAGALFAIGSITDFLDGYIARKNNIVTDFGKVMDAIADKVLVNPILIILACNGFIPTIVPVIYITRDVVVDAIKMQAATKGKVQAAIKSGKYKTACMMVGLVLVFFYNIPFAFWNIRVDLGLLIIACVLAVVSAFEYYHINKGILFSKSEK